jgi:hypothetical protein
LQVPEKETLMETFGNWQKLLEMSEEWRKTVELQWSWVLELVDSHFG